MRVGAALKRVILGMVVGTGIAAASWRRAHPARAHATGGWEAIGWGDIVDVEAAPVVVPARGKGVAVFEVKPRDGYFVYSDGLSFSAPGDAGVTLGAPELPAGELIASDEPGRARMRYDGPFSVAVPIDASMAADGLYHLQVDGRLRLCSRSGCQPVRSGKVDLTVAVGDAGSSTP